MLTKQEEIELIRLMEIEARERNSRNEIYQAYRLFKGRYAVLIGGSGSGKSYEIADKHIDRIVQEDKHRILCCRAEQKQISESQVPLIVSRIKARYEESYNKNQWKINLSKGHESITYLPNGNQFIFWGLDDAAKLKSIFDITSLWVEEADQTTPEAIRELDRRLRGYDKINKNGAKQYMQISFSFNPVSVLSYLKQLYFDNKEPNQIMLHGEQTFTDCEYWKDFILPDFNIKTKAYDENLKKEVEKYKYNTLVIHSTYLDNKFIDDNYSQILNKQKIEEPEEYNVYALGQWGITGGTYFDKGQVNKRILDNPRPIKRGYFEYTIGFNKEFQHTTIEKYEWINDKEGYISIYKQPKENYPYVLSGDTSGEGSDWNTGILTDNTTGIEVASVRINFDEDLYAMQMLCLGKMYNNALIGLEMNFSSRPMKIISEDFNYPNCYNREEAPDSYSGNIVKKIGWLTTGSRSGGGTRPLILGMLRTLVREEVYKINSIETLQEMTSFVKNEKGKAEAANGCHDDMIIAWAINLGIRGQQDNTAKIKEYDIDWNALPSDLLEDYERANDEWKKIILDRWRQQGLFKRKQ
jgi:phage terminase large subunit